MISSMDALPEIYKPFKGKLGPKVIQPEDVQVWRKKHRANWAVTAKHFGLPISTVKQYCTTFYCFG